MKRLASMIAVLFFLAAAVPAQAQDATNVLKRLRQKYRAIDALQADFTQTTHSSFTDTPRQLSGSVIMSGKQFRVETGTQTLVTNGKTTWIYTPARQQVLVNDYQDDKSTFSLNDFLFHFDKNYEVNSVKTVQRNEATHYRLSLHPKRANAFFKSLTLWVRREDALVTRLDVTDLNDIRTSYTLKDITLNPSTTASTFTFAPPDEAKVVDLRS